MDYALFGIVILGFAGLGFLLLRQSPGNPASEGEVGQLEGKNRQLEAALAKADAKLESIQREKEQLERNIAKHEEAAERRKFAFQEQMGKLEKAEQSFKEERARVIREDEMKREQQENDRDRIWADHEANVIAHLASLCKSPALAFAHYTNLNLPDGFDGSLKPDFMIDFLGQYVIFDAKASKAESLQTYIANAVKETVKKVKKDERIASTIFLVVPTQAIHELKTHHYPLDGYNLYVISPEALGPILSSLKKITAYELAEQLDPQKRENLINLIAKMDFQISLQNATSLYLTQTGIETLEQAQAVDPDLWQEAQLKKREMKIPGFSELKKLVNDAEAQQERIAGLVSPTVKVKKKDIERAKEAIVEQLL